MECKQCQYNVLHLYVYTYVTTPYKNYVCMHVIASLSMNFVTSICMKNSEGKVSHATFQHCSVTEPQSTISMNGTCASALACIVYT